MRWRSLTLVRDAKEHHILDPIRPKKFLMLGLVVTVMTGFMYVFLGIKHNFTQLPLGPLRNPPHENSAAPKSHRTDSSPSTTPQAQAPNTESLNTTPVAHPLTTKHALLPLTTNPSTMPSASPSSMHPSDKELEPGDSNMPYPSTALESIKGYPPDTVFMEPTGADDDDKLKKILFWNDDFYNKHFGFGFGREPFLFSKCRVNTCTTTGNRDRYPFEEIDAVIWHLRASDKSFPPYRSPHTRYVLWLKESPSYIYADMNDYNNTFNWTLTYRLDSDFPSRYNQVFRRRHPLPKTDHNYAGRKTKLAAWFVSHCSTDSGRITLTRTLQEYIPVDIFGACGQFDCPRKSSHECYAMLNATYKFYLAFENSLCKDYTTEKFFNILRLDVVPIVYGLGNYSLVAPPHSYIDALSFPTVRALADYILYLNSNDTAYNEYFRWKRFHIMYERYALDSQPFCSLCERLHTDNTTKIYNMQKWYVDDAHCKSKTHPDIHNFINKASWIGNLSFQTSFAMFILISAASSSVFYI